MKVALGQINTTPNDFAGNLEQIFRFIDQAGEQNCDLVVFPELSIPGYLCKDLLYRRGFVEKNLAALADISEVSRKYPDLTIVVGYIGKNISKPGKKFTNMAAVICNGLAINHYQKQLLPFYDVFDEGRYFEPGNSSCYFEIAGQRCALTICEDIWNDKGQDDYNYAENPLSEISGDTIDCVINLSSSPYGFGKPQKRLRMLQEISKEHDITLIYVNQIGGQDELVFDGRSCILSKGVLIYEIASTKFTKPSCSIVSFDDQPGHLIDFIANDSTGVHPGWSSIAVREEKSSRNIKYDQLINQSKIPGTGTTKELYNSLIIGLHDYIVKTGFQQVVLGSSGGIDSAVVASLACDALGPENVHCIMMPSIFSSDGSVEHAKSLHQALGCHQYIVPIEHQHLVKSINSYFPDQLKGFYNNVADENIQARLRGLTVMHISNAFGYLPLTTGNKTELALGYCTLYGDMNGGFNPIADLYKDQVYAIARHINKGEIILSKIGSIIPEEVINKPPSAELSKNQTDEKGLGAHYGVLNAVVRSFIENHINNYECFKNWVKNDSYLFATAEDKAALHQYLENDEIAKENYYKLIRRIDYMEFKRRQAAPTIKVSSVAFGTGRRLPIVQKVN